MADDTATTDAPEVETPDADAEQLKQDAKKTDDVPPEVRRALNKANKEAESLRLQLKEFQDRDKTEAEKVAERATEAETRAVKAEAKATRLEVAFEKGLTPAQAKRLVGETREELEADADEILRDFPVKPAEPEKPTVDLDLGTRTTAATASDPRSADLAQIEADLKANKRR
jgi:Zn-dependent M32 family carboxypeptidase